MQDRAQRLMGLFRSEARESVAALAAGGLEVERGAGDDKLYGAMFRAAHTIKGGARLLGLLPIADCAERAEELIAPLREGSAVPDSERGAALIAAAEELTQLIWPDESARSTDSHAEKYVQSVQSVQPESADSTPARAPTVRVPSDRIDVVVRLASEARRAAEHLGESGRELGALLAAAEDAALRLRLVPLEGVFADLRLAVRSAAQADGKEADLATFGGEVEADASVVDATAEIVLQLARNAVAHGIEPPDERRAAGKPTSGRIEVRVRARGGTLELVVSDDGRGIDEDALRRRARERGLDATMRVEDLLFAPGLSTRRNADALAGQGVGMDIVRARAEAAGGQIGIDWQPGRGTTFTVRLPVSVLYERLVVAELDGGLIGVPAEMVEDVARGEGDGLCVDGTPDEASALTQPLGPLFAPSRLFRRGWIAPDGRVGVVLEAEEWLSRAGRGRS